MKKIISHLVAIGLSSYINMSMERTFKRYYMNHNSTLDSLLRNIL